MARRKCRPAGPLRGDVSTRRFWRVAIRDASDAPASAIAIDLGPEDLPLYARALKMYPRPASGATVDKPASVSHLARRAGSRFISIGPRAIECCWSEDVGSLPLFDAARANPAKAADLYREAVRELMRFHIDGTANANRECLAFQVAYEERLFAWEMRRFIEFGLDAVAPGADTRTIETDVASLARELGKLPRVFSHRDFHGNNIFLQGDLASPTMRIIDFQDALMAPAAQDLAVLLTTRDTSDLISPAMEERLLDFYFTGLIRRGIETMSRDAFLKSYAMCVLQHALKCIGLFVFLDREGKHEYAAYIPYALAQARRMLARLGADFPNLRKALSA